MENKNIILENEAFALTLGEDCIAKSLICKATGEECLMQGKNISIFSVTQPRPFNNEVKLAHPNKRTTFQGNRLRREGDKLIVGFEITPFEAVVTVKITESYMVFTLSDFIVHEKDYKGLSMTPPPVAEFRLLQLPVRNRTNFGEWLNVFFDEKTAINVIANNPYPRIDSERRDGYRLMTADAVKGIRLKGCEAALIVSPTGALMDAIDTLEEDYDLPRGVKSRRSEHINRSALWVTDMTPKTVDEYIAYAKMGGFRHMLVYFPSIFKAYSYRKCGDYDFRDEYPNGIKDVKEMLDKLKAEGIIPGFHFLQTHIGIESRYVTPVVDARIHKTRLFTLAKDIGEADTEIFVLQNPEDTVMFEKCRVLCFDGEAIYYESYTTEPPYRFLGCKRGHYNTTVTAHKAGCVGGVLDVSEHVAVSLYIDQDTDLQDEIAKKLAAVYNAGFEFVYFDGSEGTNEPSDFHVSNAQYRVLKQFASEPLFCESAAKSHFSWHFLSGGNAFDIFQPAVFKQKIAEFPAEEAPRMRNDFTRLNFGWWACFKDTQPDMFEYGTSRAAAWDCPTTVMRHEGTFESNPRIADNLEVIRRWENARAEGFLTEQMKEMLKNLEEEHILLINEEKKFELVPYAPLATADERIAVFAFERKGRVYAVIWHKTGEGKLCLPLKAESLCYETQLGDGDLATKTEDGCVLLDIAGRRYLSGSFTLEELKEAFEKATIKE